MAYDVGTRHVVSVGGFVEAGTVYHAHAPGNTDNGYLPSKCPIHSRNPPVAVSGDSADRRKQQRFTD